jgi:fatty-acyl-CoA synthase
MQGLMMETPLTIPGLVVPRAEREYAQTPVVARVGQNEVRTTWGEIVGRARRLATVLRDMGVREGDRVATFGWNTHWHLEAYLGIPSMGAVLHTLNIRLFPEQIVYIVDHADDSVVLVDRSLLPLWRQVEAKLSRPRPLIVMPDSDDTSNDGDAVDYEEAIAAAAPMATWPDLDENAAAAMCYTSGTTGNPKGVVYSHRSSVLHSFATAMSGTLGIGSQDIVCALVPMFHANSWGLPHAGAMVGSSLVLAGRDLSPAAVCSLIRQERVTVAAGVPTIWLGVLDYWRREKPDLSSLRTVICGGSAAPASLCKAFEEEIGVPITHAWGMTETSPIGSVSRLPVEAGQNPDAATREYYNTSQGRPVPGVEVRVTGDDGEEVPWDGATMGEICVRGPWIARQYYGDAEPDPAKFQDGWLRTGDVATVDTLGYLRIVDRTKDLVKSGGEWISSVELEGHIMAHPDVLEAAVIGVPDPKWDERPMACVVLRAEARDRVTAGDIVEFLRPRVAKWWLPEHVVFIDEVPKTSVGKFDKKVLRARFSEAPEGSAAAAASGTATA